MRYRKIIRFYLLICIQQNIQINCAFTPVTFFYSALLLFNLLVLEYCNGGSWADVHPAVQAKPYRTNRSRSRMWPPLISTSCCTRSGCSNIASTSSRRAGDLVVVHERHEPAGDIAAEGVGRAKRRTVAAQRVGTG